MQNFVLLKNTHWRLVYGKVKGGGRVWWGANGVGRSQDLDIGSMFRTEFSFFEWPIRCFTLLWIRLCIWKPRQKNSAAFLWRRFLSKIKWLRKVPHVKMFIKILQYSGLNILTKPLVLPLNLTRTTIQNVYRSALIPQNLPCPEKFLIARLRSELDIK